MAQPFLGQLSLVAFNFPPYQWAFAAGQIVSISQYSALFSLLGTMYGGNGTSNFALPNLSNNVAIGSGQLSGGSIYDQGETGGVAAVTLLNTEVPAHTHTVNSVNTGRGGQSPVGSAFGESEAGSVYYSYTGPNPPFTNMNAATVSTVGNSQPHSNQMPYLALNWIIAMAGIYPSRG